MSDHDGPGFRGDGFLNFVSINVVRYGIDIHKHRYCTELQDGVDSGGKARSNPDDFVPWPDRTIT
jgi:hypothetical protein